MTTATNTAISHRKRSADNITQEDYVEHLDQIQETIKRFNNNPRVTQTFVDHYLKNQEKIVASRVAGALQKTYFSSLPQHIILYCFSWLAFKINLCLGDVATNVYKIHDDTMDTLRDITGYFKNDSDRTPKLIFPTLHVTVDTLDPDYPEDWQVFKQHGLFRLFLRDIRHLIVPNLISLHYFCKFYPNQAGSSDSATARSTELISRTVSTTAPCLMSIGVPIDVLNEASNYYAEVVNLVALRKWFNGRPDFAKLLSYCFCPNVHPIPDFTDEKLAVSEQFQQCSDDVFRDLTVDAQSRIHKICLSLDLDKFVDAVANVPTKGNNIRTLVVDNSLETPMYQEKLDRLCSMIPNLRTYKQLERKYDLFEIVCKRCSLLEQVGLDLDYYDYQQLESLTKLQHLKYVELVISPMETQHFVQCMDTLHSFLPLFPEDVKFSLSFFRYEHAQFEDQEREAFVNLISAMNERRCLWELVVRSIVWSQDLIRRCKFESGIIENLAIQMPENYEWTLDTLIPILFCPTLRALDISIGNEDDSDDDVEDFGNIEMKDQLDDALEDLFPNLELFV